jgi:hypothetical protein
LLARLGEQRQLPLHVQQQKKQCVCCVHTFYPHPKNHHPKIITHFIPITKKTNEWVEILTRLHTYNSRENLLESQHLLSSTVAGEMTHRTLHTEMTYKTFQRDDPQIISQIAGLEG